MLNFRKYNFLLIVILTFVYSIVMVSLAAYDADPLKDIRFYHDTDKRENIIGSDFNANYFAAKRYFSKDSLYTISKQLVKYKDELSMGTDHSRFVYYPFSALFFVPFTFLSFDSAFGLLTIVNLALLFWIVYLLSNLCKNKEQYFVVIFSLFLFSPMLWTIFERGQTDIIILFFLVNCFLFYKKQNTKLSALSLVLASLFKLTPLFLLPFFYFKNKKIFYYSISFFVLISLITGAERVSDFIKSLSSFSSQHSSSYLNTGIFGFFYNKITSLYVDPKIAHSIYFLVIIPVIILFLYLVKNKLKISLKIENDLAWFGIFLGVMLLLPTVSWLQHSIHMIFVFTAYWIYREKSLLNKKIILLDSLAILIFSGPLLLRVFQQYPLLIIFSFRPIFIILFLVVFYITFLKEKNENSLYLS